MEKKKQVQHLTQKRTFIFWRNLIIIYSILSAIWNITNVYNLVHGKEVSMAFIVVTSIINLLLPIGFCHIIYYYVDGIRGAKKMIEKGCIINDFFGDYADQVNQLVEDYKKDNNDKQKVIGFDQIDKTMDAMAEEWEQIKDGFRKAEKNNKGEDK